MGLGVVEASGVGVAKDVGTGDAVGGALGVEFDITQVNFFPLLIQVYLTLLTIFT